MKMPIVIVLLMLTCLSAFAEDKAPVPASGPIEQANVVVPTVPAPLKIDTGDTAWLIVSSAFVMFMSLPGLAIFYGGIAKMQGLQPL